MEIIDYLFIILGSIIGVLFLCQLVLAIWVGFLEYKKYKLLKEKNFLKWDSYNAIEEGRAEYDPDGIFKEKNRDEIQEIKIKIDSLRKMIDTFSILRKF